MRRSEFVSSIYMRLKFEIEELVGQGGTIEGVGGQCWIHVDKFEITRPTE